MKKTIKSSLMAATAVTAALTASQIQAEEAVVADATSTPAVAEVATPQTAAAETVTATAAPANIPVAEKVASLPAEVPTPVTQADVDTATNVAAETQTAVEQQTAVVNQAAQTAETAATNVTTAEENVAKAENLVTEATPENITNAETAVATAKEALTAAEAEVPAKETAVQAAQANVDQQQANVNTAKAATETAKTAANAAQAKVDEAQAVIDKADTAQAEVDQAKANLDKTQQERVKAILTSTGAPNAIKEEQAKLEEAKKEETNKTAAQKAAAEKIKQLEAEGKAATSAGTYVADGSITLDPEFIKAVKNKDHAAINAAIDKIKAKTPKGDTYTAPSNAVNNQVVDVTNLSQEVKEELTNFGLALINQIRTQFGYTPLKATKGMMAFADEVTKTSKAVFYHDNAAINAAAIKHGLTPVLDETGQPSSEGQMYEDLNGTGKILFTEPKNTRITVGQIKEDIFEAYRWFLYDDAPYKFEHTFNVTGVNDYRNNATEYGLGFGYLYTTFDNGVSGYVPHVRSLQATAPLNITDASKYDATPIGATAPTAEYTAAVEAEKNAAAELATAKAAVTTIQSKINNYQALVDAAEAAEAKFLEAQAAYDKALDFLNKTKADDATKQENLANAKIVLEQAQEQVQLAETNLAAQEAELERLTNILTLAQTTLKDAQDLVAARQQAVADAEQYLYDLQNADQILADAQAELEAAIEAKTQADADLAAAEALLADILALDKVAQTYKEEVLKKFNAQTASENIQEVVNQAAKDILNPAPAPVKLAAKATAKGAKVARTAKAASPKTKAVKASKASKAKGLGSATKAAKTLPSTGDQANTALTAAGILALFGLTGVVTYKRKYQ